MKLRPVLTLTEPIGSVPEVLVAYISSVIPTSILPSDIVLDPTNPAQAMTNLRTLSVLRLHKLATVHGRSIVRRIGSVSSQTSREVDDRLRAMLRL
jgi:mRNA interferase MazF